MSQGTEAFENGENGRHRFDVSVNGQEGGLEEASPERKLEAAKDAMLRLRERHGRIRGQVQAVEERAKRTLWITGGISLGGVLLLVALLFTAVFPLQRQVAELQASVAVLQEQGQRAQGQTVEQAGHGAEQNLVQSIQTVAPDIIAATLQDALRIDTEGNIDIGKADADPPTPVKIHGNLIGAVRGPGGEPLRVVLGKTNPQQTNWVSYTPGGVYTDVDTSTAGFTTAPQYFTSLSGAMRHNLARGATSIYQPTAQGFRVYISLNGLTPEKAQEWGWTLSWIAVGE